MFTRLTRIATLAISLMAVVGVTQASAWTITGSTTFTATSNAFSFSTAAGTMSCTGGTIVGAFSASSSSAVPWNGAATGSTTFSGCRIGGTTYSLMCTYTLNLTGSSGGVTNLNLYTLSCSYRLAASEICRFVARPGGFGGRYTNSTKSFTFPASPNFTAFNGSGTTCPLGNNATLIFTTWNWVVTSSPAPVINP